MTRDSHEPVPAIVRGMTDADLPSVESRDTEGKIISTPRDTVSFRRGFGDSGHRIQVVEHDCPECSFDRMVRRVDVSPDLQNEVRYWCLNPNCLHYVSDHLSHACHGNYPQRDTNEPALFEGVDL